MEESDLVRKAEQLADKEPFNVAFVGIGDIAEAAIIALTNSSLNNFNRPIGQVYLVGDYNKESTSRRERIINSAEDNLFRSVKEWPHRFEVLSKTYDELKDDVLPNTDLLFLTQSTKFVLDRMELAIKNKEIPEKLANSFTGDNFTGLVNIIVNEPSVIGQKAGLLWNLVDPRQITVHTPLDMNRAKRILYNLIQKSIEQEDSVTHDFLKSFGYEDIDFFLTGYHNLILPILTGAKANLGTLRTGIKISRLSVEMEDFLFEYTAASTLVSKIEQEPFNQFQLLKKQLGDEINKTPTVHETATSAIQFLKAVVNREPTTTGILHEINGESYYVVAPTVNKYGYPELDTEKWKRMNENDQKNLEKIIVGPYSKPEEKAKPLRQVIELVYNKYESIEIPKSTETLKKCFDQQPKKTPVPQKIWNFVTKKTLPELLHYSVAGDYNSLLVNNLNKDTTFKNIVTLPDTNSKTSIEKIEIDEKNIYLGVKDDSNSVPSTTFYQISHETLNPERILQLKNKNVIDWSADNGKLVVLLPDSYIIETIDNDIEDEIPLDKLYRSIILRDSLIAGIHKEGIDVSRIPDTNMHQIAKGDVGYNLKAINTHKDAVIVYKKDGKIAIQDIKKKSRILINADFPETGLYTSKNSIQIAYITKGELSRLEADSIPKLMKKDFYECGTINNTNVREVIKDGLFNIHLTKNYCVVEGGKQIGVFNKENHGFNIINIPGDINNAVIEKSTK